MALTADEEIRRALGSAHAVGLDPFIALMQRRRILSTVDDIRNLAVDDILQTYSDTIRLTNGVEYFYDRASAVADDGASVIAPLRGLGRWIRRRGLESLGGARSLEEFSGKPLAELVGSTKSDNAQLAWEASVASGEKLRLQAGEYFFEEKITPVRSLCGLGRSDTVLKAQTAFSGDILCDLNGLADGSCVKHMEINANQQCPYAFGVDIEVAGFGSFHSFADLYIRGGTDYQINFPSGGEVSSPAVASTWHRILVDASNAAAIMRLGTAVDDVLFADFRFRTFGACDSYPIHIGDTCHNINFFGVYADIAIDFAAGIEALFRYDGGTTGQVRGFFLEPRHVTFANLMYMFFVDAANLSISDGICETGPTMPAGAAFAHLFATGSNRILELENITNQLTNMDKVLDLTTSDASGSSLTKIAMSGLTGFSSVAGQKSGSLTTNDTEVAHLAGSLNGVTYDHGVQSDGSNLFLYKKPAPGTRRVLTASDTAVLADAEIGVRMNVGVANTFTFPPNSDVNFPANCRIPVFNKGAGTCTLTPGAGVTLNGTAALAQNEGAIVQQSATLDEWDILRG